MEMGANNRQLDYIGKTSPPEEVNLMGRLKGISCAALADHTAPTIPRPWFITDVTILEYMFQTRFDDVVRDFEQQFRFSIDDDYSAAAISFLAWHNRRDLIECVLRNAPRLVKQIDAVFAVLSHNVECLKFLQQTNAELGYNIEMLSLAAATGNVKMAQYLISLDRYFIVFDIVRNTVFKNDLPMVQLLCEKFGNDENALTDEAFEWALDMKFYPIAIYLFENYPSKCSVDMEWEKALEVADDDAIQFLLSISLQCPDCTEIADYIGKVSMIKEIFSSHCKVCEKVYALEP